MIKVRINTHKNDDIVFLDLVEHGNGIIIRGKFKNDFRNLLYIDENGVQFYEYLENVGIKTLNGRLNIVFPYLNSIFNEKG